MESANRPPQHESAPATTGARPSPAVEPAPQTLPSASVIIPTYNEADNIIEVINRCREALDPAPGEVLVVDDDSPDGTWRLVADRFDDLRHVRVVRRTENRGLSTAIARGFREALFDVCVVIDADLQHPPERIPSLLDAFDEETDLVIASRYVDRGGIERWSAWRKVVSRAATVLAKGCLPPVRRVADPLSGFFAVRRDLLADVRFSPIGYKILLELLVRCECGAVKEVPYVFRDREVGDSKLAVDEYLNFLRHLNRLRHHRATTASSG